MAKPRKRTLVTGGAGFIGAHVCGALREQGLDVIVLDDFSSGTMANLRGLDVRVLYGSILDDELLAAAFEGVRCVVHLAARPSVPRSLQSPTLTHDVNCTGTLRVLEAARAVGAHTILASSSSVYGASRDLPKRESALPAPVSPYAASKLAAEGYALAYSRCFALPVLVFRFFNVYGPLQPPSHAYAAVIPRFLDAALRGDALEIHGDGRQTRDFTYVGTVAQIVRDAVLGNVVRDGPVNVAFGTRISLLELVQRIEGLVGHDLSLQYSQARAGDVRDSQADTAVLRALFPDVAPVDLAEGLAPTIDWLRAVLISESADTSIRSGR